jgi:hypothetical protein
VLRAFASNGSIGLADASEVPRAFTVLGAIEAPRVSCSANVRWADALANGGHGVDSVDAIGAFGSDGSAAATIGDTSSLTGVCGATAVSMAESTCAMGNASAP